MNRERARALAERLEAASDKLRGSSERHSVAGADELIGIAIIAAAFLRSLTEQPKESEQ